MKITELTGDRMKISLPDSTFKFICFIVIGLGFIVTVAVFFSGEGLVNGIPGYLFLIGGVLGLRFGGKPDSLLLDKRSDLLEIQTRKGSFSKPEITSYKLSHIMNVDLDESIFQSSNSSFSGRRVWAVRFYTKEGKTFPGTFYGNRKKNYLYILNRIREFLMLPL